MAALTPVERTEPSFYVPVVAAFGAFAGLFVGTAQGSSLLGIVLGAGIMGAVAFLLTKVIKTEKTGRWGLVALLAIVGFLMGGLPAGILGAAFGWAVPMAFAAQTGGVPQLAWIVFGAAVIGQSWSSMPWSVVIYAVLSLTLIRMLPMLLALKGTGEPLQSKLFLGWFGPRGLASIVFAVIVLNSGLEGGGILAMTVVSLIPITLVFVWLQRFITTGIATTGLK